MMLAHAGDDGQVAHAWLQHLNPYLSVSLPVGPGRDNRKLDVMLVQYLMARLARDQWDSYDRPRDRFRVAFLNAEKEAGRRFAIDGLFGDRTAKMIRTYQQMGLNLPLDGAGGTTYMAMTEDGVVHPGPDGGKGVPIGSGGRLYMIAHLNERFRMLHLSYQSYICGDEEAPEALKRRVRELLPPTVQGGLPPASNAPSLHIARSRFQASGR